MASHDQPLPTLDEFDKDGALRETAEAAQTGLTRRRAMTRTGVLVGGGLAIGALPVALSIGQGGSTPQSDVDILNYALTLEYLEAAFYKKANEGGALTGDYAKFARVVADHEAQHVEALKKALGSKAGKKPTFDFKGTTDDEGMFGKTSMTLEDTGVMAYLGQVPKIKSAAVLGAAGSILPVEARHASWIRDILGKGASPAPAPNAFDAGKPMSDILSAVKATGFIQ